MAETQDAPRQGALMIPAGAALAVPGSPAVDFRTFGWLGQRVVVYGNPKEGDEELVGYVQRLGPVGVELLEVVGDEPILHLIPYAAIRMLSYFPEPDVLAERGVLIRMDAPGRRGPAPGL